MSLNSDSPVWRLVSLVVTVLVGAWLLSQIGLRLTLDIIVAVGKGVAGLVAGFFGFGG